MSCNFHCGAFCCCWIAGCQSKAISTKMLVGSFPWQSIVCLHHGRWMSRSSYGVQTSGFYDNHTWALQEGVFARDKPAWPNPILTRCLASQHGSDSSDHAGGKPESDAPPPLKYCLHDLMDAAGLDTLHARAARADYEAEIRKLHDCGTSSSGSGISLDLARAALGIAAEDDALVSHSSVPLPVDLYMARIDGMATEFAGHHLPERDRSPSAVFDALDNYMYVYQGFKRPSSVSVGDARDSYLNSVLTRKVGTPVMLALIYSELVKRLFSAGAIDFLAEVELPVDPVGLPRAQAASHHETSRLESPSAPLKPVLLTPQLLLVEVLRALKQLFWPWKSWSTSVSGSGFLEAANAANRGSRSDSLSPFESLFAAPSSDKGADIASARAAQLRLQRGIWTSSSFGDIRRALAVSERLVLLGLDEHENRDYGMLLFHCGLYQDAYAYLSAYSTSEIFTRSPTSYSELTQKAHAAVECLLERLRLILLEQSWEDKTDQSIPKNVPPDPW